MGHGGKRPFPPLAACSLSLFDEGWGKGGFFNTRNHVLFIWSLFVVHGACDNRICLQFLGCGYGLILVVVSVGQTLVVYHLETNKKTATKKQSQNATRKTKASIKAKKQSTLQAKMEQLSRAFWHTFWKRPRSGVHSDALLGEGRLSGALLGEGPLSGALLVAFCSLLSPGPGEKSHFWLISRIKPPLVDITIKIYISR